MEAMTQDEARRQAHYEKMTQTPVPKLVTTLAIPTIISMMVSAIYNMADTFFVSQLGTSAVGAVGIVFSLMAIIQAVGFTLGMGSGTIVSLHLGAKEDDKATCAASTGFFTAIVMGLLLTIFGSIFVVPLMRLLGATETILPYARDYGQYILLAAPIMCASFVMNNIFRCEGKSVLGMLGIGTGGILNIILDPIFIFGLGLGTAGAAIATALSQTVSFIILLILFLKGKSDVRLRITKVSKKLKTYVDIITTGMPTLCRQGLASLASVALNVNAAIYGVAAVAAMIIVGTVVMAVFSLVIFIFSPQILMAFRRDDAVVIELGSFALRAQCLVMPFCGVTTTANMALQSTGQSGRATFLALCRQGVFFLPLILILPRFCGVLGVQLAQPLADACTMAASIPFLVAFMRRLKVMNVQEGENLCKE